MELNRLISFASVHHAIRAEKLLAAAGIRIVALPTPREIDISCGQCLLFNSACQEQVLEILKDGQAQWSKLFSRQQDGKVYEKLSEYEVNK